MSALAYFATPVTYDRKSFIASAPPALRHTNQGTLSIREGLSTVHLLIKVTCFATKVNNIFDIKN